LSEYGSGSVLRILIAEDGKAVTNFISNEMFEKFFEEIKEPVDSIHWKPKIGDKCFILENTNIRPTAYTGMLRDYNAWRTGRVFRTKGECEKHRTLSQTLKMAKAAGLSAMTMRITSFFLCPLVVLTTENPYITRLGEKLKNPLKKTEKIGRFILELRRKNNVRHTVWWLKSGTKNLASNPNFYAEIGRKGGSATFASHGSCKGFAQDIECDCDLIEGTHFVKKCAGKKGGRISKRK